MFIRSCSSPIRHTNFRPNWENTWPKLGPKQLINYSLWRSAYLYKACIRTLTSLPDSQPLRLLNKNISSVFFTLGRCHHVKCARTFSYQLNRRMSGFAPRDDLAKSASQCIRRLKLFYSSSLKSAFHGRITHEYKGDSLHSLVFTSRNCLRLAYQLKRPSDMKRLLTLCSGKII